MKTGTREGAARLLLGEDQRAVEDLYRKMRLGHPKLVGPDGEARSLPARLYDFLAELTSDLGAGRSVAITQRDATLTTVEAARMIGVSRAFLIKILARGDVPFHKVGTHRRIYVRDLLQYKAQRDKNRRQALDELVHSEVDEGLYDLVPLRPHDDSRQ